MAPERKVELLETTDVEARVEKVLDWAREALAEHEVTERIRAEVNDGLEKTQREFLLRQQLAAIRKELGEDGGAESGEDYRTRIAEALLPEKVARGCRARGRQARAHERAESRARVDPHLARHDVGGPVGHALRRPARHP